MFLAVLSTDFILLVYGECTMMCCVVHPWNPIFYTAGHFRVLLFNEDIDVFHGQLSHFSYCLEWGVVLAEIRFSAWREWPWKCFRLCFAWRIFFRCIGFEIVTRLGFSLRNTNNSGPRGLTWYYLLQRVIIFFFFVSNAHALLISCLSEQKKFLSKVLGSLRSLGNKRSVLQNVKSIYRPI